MANTKIRMNINGIMVECTPTQAKSLLRDVQGNARGTTEEITYKPTNEVRKAVSNISGDTSAEFILNVLNAKVGGVKPNGEMIPIHVVYHGLNTVIRDRYSDDPRTVTELMAEKGLIDLRGAKGGAIISLPNAHSKGNVILRKAS